MTARLPAALVAVLAAACPSFAVEPLSAIPWLSLSVDPAAAPPPARPAGTPAAEASDTITVTPLNDVRRDATGLVPPAESGFARDLWGPTRADEARSLILAHRPRAAPEARALFHRLLLAEADAPPGSDGTAALLIARVDRLLGMGAVEEASALLGMADPNTPDLFRRWFDAGLLLDEAEPPCDALRQNPSLSPTLPARVFCLARGGDWNAAEITLTLGEGVGSIPPDQERLLARFLDPALFEGEPDPAIPDPLTPLDFLLREAVGLARPSGPLPLAFLQADLDEHAPMRVRIDAAERLALSDAVAPGVLFEAYRAGEPAASGGAWDRAAAVQDLDAAFAAGDPARIGTALVSADRALAARGLRVAFARDSAAALAEVDPGGLSPVARRAAFELLLLADDPETARPFADPADPRDRALLAVAGVGEAPPDGPDDLTRAALDGLAPRGPGDTREIRLRAALESGRQGAALIEALDLLPASGPADPAALRAALHILTAAGQTAAARRVALQTLLAPDGA